MMTPTMDLAHLQRQAGGGDADAQAELIRAFYPRVRALVHRELESDFRRHHRWILPLFSTGDIVQDVFVAVVKSLDDFQADGEDAFVRYLTTLVKHRLIDAVRHHEAGRRDVRRELGRAAGGGSDGSGEETAPDPRDRAVADDPTPSLCASLAEQMRVFREVLAELPERQRALLELRLEHEEPYADIAQKLGIPSADAARKAFRDAQARLLLRLRSRGVEAPGEGA